MTADFGPDKALMPIITLSREGFKEYVETYSAKSARASVNAPGVYTYGTVIVNALDALDSRSEFPTPENRLLVDTVRHEGVHSTMPGEEILAITRPLMEGDQNVTEQEKASGHIIIPVKVGGFLEYNPGVNFYDATGKFIEEGFSESYAVRAKSNEISQITGGAPSIMIQRPDLGFQNSIIFSDDETQKLYSAADNTIYIPWRYACDVKVRASAKNRYSAISTPDAFAAYTIDILDCALPGLYQKMIESRCNPNVKEQVKERINSVQPGLYKQLSGLALNPRGLESGLVRTVIALGLADKRVKDVLRS
jgi:hypothetical protein